MEEKFVRLADLQKFPLRRDHYDKEHGNEHFINGIETMFEYIDELPKYEIAVRDEVNVTDDVCKALKCCTTQMDVAIDPCEECPMYCGESSEECITNMCIAALDVILHQRATIEFLQKTIRENEQRHLEVLLEETAKAGAEVASAVVEDVQALLFAYKGYSFNGIYYEHGLADAIAELKKEYTEENKNDNSRKSN